MLIKVATLRKIASGDIDLVYRRWKKPSVRAGSSLLTAVGVIDVVSVKAIAMRAIRAADAARAGYETRAELIDQLSPRQGTTYRIEVRYGGADPRAALREKPVSDAERAELEGKLDRLPWAMATLELIRDNPGVRAEDLAARIGLAKKQFKPRVRRLKALGLTVSLPIGYRLSPRGVSLLG